MKTKKQNAPPAEKRPAQRPRTRRKPSPIGELGRFFAGRQRPAKVIYPTDAERLAQHAELKRKHPEYLVHIRRGDEFEFYGEDAKIVSKILKIPIQTRGEGESQISFVSVNQAFAGEQLQKVVAAGHRVAIAEPAIYREVPEEAPPAKPSPLGQCH